MTFTALRIAMCALVLIVPAGAALSDSAPTKGKRLAALGTACPAGQTQAAAPVPLGVASTTARHTNAIRVRYAAAHAMPARRAAPSVAEGSCGSGFRSSVTAID